MLLPFYYRIFTYTTNFVIMVTIILHISPQFLLSMPGGGEWLWILIAVIVLFGARKIPDLAKGLGKGMKEFKDARDAKDDKPAKQGDNDKQDA